jgi:hypothetical protein
VLQLAARSKGTRARNGDVRMVILELLEVRVS